MPSATTLSPKLATKQQLLAECLRIQKETVEHAKTAMNEYQTSAMEYDEAAEDNMVDSYREEMQSKRDMFARQMEQALDDLALLNKVIIEDTPEASFGSVIITEQQKLFISISLGQIKAGNETYFAISPSAPLYKAVVGKKAGESFDFRDKKIKVLDVY